jgi:hypothetical protein
MGRSESSDSSRILMSKLVPQLKDHIYALSPESSLFIGKRSLGQISNYYLGERVEDHEVAAIQAAAEKFNIDVLNTRLVVLLTQWQCPPPYEYNQIVSRKTGQMILLSWLPRQNRSHL